MKKETEHEKRISTSQKLVSDLFPFYSFVRSFVCLLFICLFVFFPCFPAFLKYLSLFIKLFTVNIFLNIFPLTGALLSY